MKKNYYVDSSDMASSHNAIRGLIMVPMALKRGLSVPDCDDWYNNEHVPIRMRLPYFQHGYRYRSVESGINGPNDSGLPEWLALYDIADMPALTKKEYIRLLQPEVQSLRENQIIPKISASRKYYDLVSTYESPDFMSPEASLRKGDVGKAYGGTLIVVGVRLSSDSLEAETEWNRWYEEDHLPPLRKVPGWQRTRRYRTSVIEDAPGELPNGGVSTVEYLTLNEFAEGAGIGGPEHQFAIRTESRTSVVASKWRHSYKLHYLQGAASRDLPALARPAVDKFVSPDGLTKTVSGPRPRIESYIIARDNAIIPYVLEGAVESERQRQTATATFVLCTTAGLSWECWNGFVNKLLSRQDAATGTCRVVRLMVPTRLQNADQALSDVATGIALVKNDLDDCFQALMIGKAACLLSLGVGGRTADLSASPGARVVKQIGDLETLCNEGAIITCDSRQSVAETVDCLEAAVLTSDDLNLCEKILNSLH